MNFYFIVFVLFAVVMADDNPREMIPKSCAIVVCNPPPKICPNGEPPTTRPYMGCCRVCPTEPIYCKRLMCAIAPRFCPNGRSQVRMRGECCAECTNNDCSEDKEVCIPPISDCREGEIPKPRGVCCATCKLDCTWTYCLPCPAGYRSEISPNSCCPVCHER